MMLKVCAVYYKSTVMYYCVFIFACYVKRTVGQKEMHFATVVAEWSF